MNINECGCRPYGWLGLDGNRCIRVIPRQNQPMTTPVAATDLETDVTAPVDAEYDTDELAELPTDSESEAMESEQGEDPAQLEGQ